MGWRFRRSLRMGPIRWNLSRRGIGGSWGFPGFRLGMSADGKRYLSVGFPGTGLYYMHYFGGKKSATPGNATTLPQTTGSAQQPCLPSIPVLPPTQVTVPITATPTSPHARLLVKHNGAITGEDFDVTAHTVVGRADLAAGHVDIDLGSLQEARLVSAQHAEIRHQSGVGWVIRDLGSRNGSFLRHVNESAFHRIPGEEVLNDEDEVSFGNARFEFRVGETNGERQMGHH